MVHTYKQEVVKLLNQREHRIVNEECFLATALHIEALFMFVVLERLEEHKMTHEEKVCREAQVADYIRNNPTKPYREIGQDFGLTQARVSQIAKKFGVSRPRGCASPAWSLKVRVVQ